MPQLCWTEFVSNNGPGAFEFLIKGNLSLLQLLWKKDQNGGIWTPEDPVSLGCLWLSGEVKGHARAQPLGQKIGASAGATVRWCFFSYFYE